MNWTRLISSCAKLDHEPSVPLDLSIAQNTGYKIVVKQDSLSFITVCDDSEILYHTFQDKQFEVAQLIASPTSRLSKAYPTLQGPTLRQDVSKIFSAMSLLGPGITEESAKNLETIISQLAVMNGPRNFIEIMCQEPHSPASRQCLQLPFRIKVPGQHSSIRSPCCCERPAASQQPIYYCATLFDPCLCHLQLTAIV
jgi:hypothetical protein